MKNCSKKVFHNAKGRIFSLSFEKIQLILMPLRSYIIQHIRIFTALKLKNTYIIHQCESIYQHHNNRIIETLLIDIFLKILLRLRC